MSQLANHVRYGPLDCLVADGGERPRAAVVLCHGYGAPGDDLVGLASQWIDQLGESAAAYRFVFPAAPNSLEEMGLPEGRAWWPINMARLAEAVQAERFGDLYTEEPPGIDAAREALGETVTAVQEDLGINADSLVLGGFSQGAMLTMDYALRSQGPPLARLLQFSGMLICRDRWQASAKRLSDTPVFQSHGTLDPVLPFAGGTALKDLLTEQGVSVAFHSFLGPHTIDPDAVVRSGEILRRLAEPPRRD